MNKLLLEEKRIGQIVQSQETDIGVMATFFFYTFWKRVNNFFPIAPDLL